MAASRTVAQSLRIAQRPNAAAEELLYSAKYTRALLNLCLQSLDCVFRADPLQKAHTVMYSI